MSDLISRQMAIDAAMQDVSDKRSHDFNAGATRAANRIKQLPSAEREIIRCKDCKYNNGGRCGWHGGAGYKWVVDDDDFCSCGERRTE